jgi:predicted RNase H-like HicB family nuclease
MGVSFYWQFIYGFVEMVWKFAVVVEKDEEGYYVASVPELPSCHTQAKTLDELMIRVKEAIEAYLEAEGYKPKEGVELVGFQFVEVSAK